MRRLFYVTLIMGLAINFLMARPNRSFNKWVVQNPAQISAKVNFLTQLPVEPIKPFATAPVSQKRLQKSNKVMQTTAGTNIMIDVSGNGYGWLNPMTRKLDRWTGTDVQTSDARDVVLVAYRGELSDADGSARDICATELDVSAGLGAGATYTWSGDDGTELNAGISGIGGRYPSVTALDYPFVFFNQYISGDVQTVPAESHPYMITDWGTYLDNGGIWSTPDFLMDQGWLDPDLNDLFAYKVNRLWNGAVTVVKDANNIYHWCGVYETWFSDLEKQNNNKQNHKNIMTATSFDDTPANGWTYGWDVGNDPVLIDPNVVSLPRCGISMNSSGFGVIAGPGHLGWHDPDSGYYYNETKITYAVTYDYGVTWSAWDTVSFGAMGIPTYHNAEDSLLWDVTIIGTDTIYTPYQGPTFLGTNFDMSVLVDENNTIYVAFNCLWGKPGDGGWYPSPYYSGIWLAKKTETGVWEGSHVAYNNGVYEGDEQISGMSAYFFDSELQVSRDDQGNLYMAWLDRRRTQVQVSRFNRYSDPETYGSDATYKTDIYAAHSIDGGVSWSDQINCTDSPGVDEYELSLSPNSANQTARGDYGKIWYSFCIADTLNGDPAVDAYIELANEVWVGEASNFNPPAAIGDETPVVRTYSLEQNYPNPFNPTTTIEFVPLTNGRATLSVFNTAGQKVATLFNGNVIKGENYQLTFDATGLASGVYFYKLQTEQGVEIKKMVLMK
ncbi:hypothetical protein Calab_2064 [Caldithrix abyssi DSM 13497]|uniref:Por secretion system C-terminal sorting domain-containing protein n=1 Tax=Caldithrix abyssi DSM 13497 TaxID=880073 RepID=H1XUX7_CALAY|nr:T9SS type A sorting domain-containing protein [Caldithrix abyssi]APF17583.1 Por secretion system C-terminal sorting domain-containing protein [Caldithrix abyssi DSM 13497]EHO41676.1 hypothetical protein Calab_2064 [Caldithrix abyssi DSM 13497]